MIRIEVPYEYEVFATAKRTRTPKWHTIRSSFEADIRELSLVDRQGEILLTSRKDLVQDFRLGHDVRHPVFDGRMHVPYSIHRTGTAQEERTFVTSKNYEISLRVIRNNMAMWETFKAFHMPVFSGNPHLIVKADVERMHADEENLVRIQHSTKEESLATAMRCTDHLSFIDGELHTSRYDLTLVKENDAWLTEANDTIDMSWIASKVTSKLASMELNPEKALALKSDGMEIALDRFGDLQLLRSEIPDEDILTPQYVSMAYQRLHNPVLRMFDVLHPLNVGLPDGIEDALGLLRRSARYTMLHINERDPSVSAKGREALQALADALRGMPDRDFAWSRAKVEEFARLVTTPVRRWNDFDRQWRKTEALRREESDRPEVDGDTLELLSRMA